MLTAVFSYVLIPAATFFLARGTGYFSTNFSSIRTAFSRQTEFIGWSIMTGFYFYLSLRTVLNAAGKYDSVKKETVLLASSAWMMLCFVITPYLPARFPFFSMIHVVSALASCVFLFFLLLLMAVKVYEAKPKEGRVCLLILHFTAVFCIVSWILSGIINTAMEIWFVLAVCFLIRRFQLLFSK